MTKIEANFLAMKIKGLIPTMTDDQVEYFATQIQPLAEKTVAEAITAYVERERTEKEPAYAPLSWKRFIAVWRAKPAPARHEVTMSEMATGLYPDLQPADAVIAYAKATLAVATTDGLATAPDWFRARVPGIARRQIAMGLEELGYTREVAQAEAERAIPRTEVQHVA